MKKNVIVIAVVAVLIVAIAAGAAVFILTRDTEKEKEVFFYKPGEAFITNLKDSNTLVKVDVTIGYDNKKAAADLEKNNSVIRNDIVFILRNKTKSDMQAEDIEQILSDEICAKLNEDLGVDYFVKIYFSDLVLQG